MTAKQLQNAVSEVFELDFDIIISRSKVTGLFLARCAYAYHRRLDGAAYSQIGRELGNRTFATVIHACKKYVDEYHTNSDFRKKTNAINRIQCRTTIEKVELIINK